MENQPGNGYNAPFGNEKGATMSDGPSSGAHDFLTDPKSHAPATGGRDFSKESRPQHAGPPSYNPETVPAGGCLPFPAADPKGNVGADGVTVETPTAPRKPFRVGDAAPVGMAAQPPTMAGDVPEDH